MFIRFEVFGTKSLLLLDRREYLGKKHLPSQLILYYQSIETTQEFLLLSS